eukprot:6206862-Pleurochrysis_carterae.AAC.2
MKHRSFVDKEKEAEHKEQWEALKVWHLAYSTSDSITVGMAHTVVPAKGDTPALKIGGCPAVP